MEEATDNMRKMWKDRESKALEPTRTASPIKRPIIEQESYTIEKRVKIENKAEVDGAHKINMLSRTATEEEIPEDGEYETEEEEEEEITGGFVEPLSATQSVQVVDLMYMETSKNCSTFQAPLKNQPDIPTAAFEPNFPPIASEFKPSHPNPPSMPLVISTIKTAVTSIVDDEYDQEESPLEDFAGDRYSARVVELEKPAVLVTSNSKKKWLDLIMN